MAILRTESNLNVSAPPPTPSRMEPPSPIPRAAGSRSAANRILAEFLEKSLHVPELALPESAEIARDNQVPYEISLRSLVSRENDSVDQLLKSAREFGVFRIKCHGISGEELGSLVKEAERVFRILEERDTGYRWEIGGRSDNKEEIVWVRSGKERMDWACEYIGAELFRSFSEKVETVASKLDTISEQLGQVLVRYLGKQLGKRTQEKQSALSIYKYNHNNIINEQNPSSSKEKHENDSCDHILSLHLPAEKCQYWVESGEYLFCFDAGPNVIVVTLGKQLEEWSLGEFKCVHGEMIHQPDFLSSFSLELNCSSLNFKKCCTTTQKKISIADQILIGLIMAILYHVFKFLWS